MLDQGIHIVHGTLGDGKTLRAVQIAEWFLQRERKVVTNVNLNIEYLCNHTCDKVLVTRVPDKPTIEHLKSVGMGSEIKGEFGLLLLDELGMWFNSRKFQEKGREELIQFIIHLRKFRWIAVFIAQKPAMIDKQARDIGSMLHSCKSTKKMFWLKWLPRIHLCTMQTSYGMKCGNDFYRATQLFPAYDHEQKYSDVTEDNFSDDDPPEIRHSKIWNGHYQLLPPTKLNPDLLAEATRYQNDLDIKSLKKTAIAAVMFLAIFFFWPGRESPIAISESSTSVEEIITKDFLKEESLQDQLYGLRVQHYRRVGSNFNYVFSQHGRSFSQSYVESMGVLVRSRGREALLVFPDGEIKSVF